MGIKYKYLTKEAAVEVLTHSTLKYSKAKYFNDIFDSQLPHLSKGLSQKDYLREILTTISNLDEDEREIKNPFYIEVRNTFKKFTAEQKVDFINEVITEHSNKFDFDKQTSLLNELTLDMQDSTDSIYVLCLTESYKNLLMWSHYAANHTGIVLGFESKSNTSYFNAAQPINYISKREVPIKIEDHIFKTQEEVKEVMFQRSLFTKSSHWAYEQEQRIIKSGSNGDLADYEFIPFQIDELTCVYFGFQMETIHQSKIAELIRIKYPNVEMFHLTPDENEFKLISHIYKGL